MATTITISAYLKGISPLVTDEALDYVCAKRRLIIDDDFFTLSEKEADLAEATIYYWLCNLPVGGATEKVSDGGWSQSEGGWTVSKANIDEWRRKYLDLYSKWNETPIGGSTIRIRTF